MIIFFCLKFTTLRKLIGQLIFFSDFISEYMQMIYKHILELYNEFVNKIEIYSENVEKVLQSEVSNDIKALFLHINPKNFSESVRA